MKSVTPFYVAIGAAISLIASATTAAESASKPATTAAVEEINTICPICGKPVDPKIALVYEGRTYAFAAEACRTKFDEERKASLYHRLGGKAAIDGVVEAFYVKVLADARIKHFFEDINMNKQRRKQKEFLAAAIGGPIPWTGKDMRMAHANLPGLNETHFNAVAENLQNTLVELKVPKGLTEEVMAIAASTRDEVLNRKPTAK